jgi:ABC-type proline/glycine betaine transport system permease subunit
MFQYLVIAMSIALILSILLGVFLAFKTSRKKWPVWTALILGFIIPVVLLWLGQSSESPF